MNLKKVCALLLAFAAGFAFAQESDIVTVKGKGVGVDETAALKDAYRDAVETAVGLYVDAEQMVKNDELIKDEILTQSNAYIEGYKELSRTSDKGVVTIKIVANVRTRKLAKRIEGVMPAKCVAVGSQLANIHAQSVTRETCGKDAVAIFKKELQELRKLRHLYEIELASPEGRPVERKERRVYRNGGYVAEQNNDGDYIEMDYLLRMTINSKRYFEEVVPRLDGVLSQISIEEPKTVRCSCDVDASGKAYEVDYLKRGMIGSYGHKIDQFILRFGCTMDNRLGYSGNPYGRRATGPLSVLLITYVNETMTVVRGKRYLLGQECANAYLEWGNERVKNGRGTLREQLPNAVVDFLGDDGAPIAESEVTMYAGEREGPFCESIEKGYWRITPWIGGDAKSYVRWFRVKLPKSDLPKIKSIKVELSE